METGASLVTIINMLYSMQFYESRNKVKGDPSMAVEHILYKVTVDFKFQFIMSVPFNLD